MCSLNDEICDNNCNNEEKTEDILDTSICKKCSTSNVEVVLRGKDTYCKACFLTATTHKFRAAIGKSKIIQKNDSILAVHTGSTSSTALLHLIKLGTMESKQKRIIFNTTVLYIDDSIIENGTNSINRISKQVEEFGFTGYVTSLSQSLNTDPVVHPMKDAQIPTDLDQAFLQVLDSSSDLTAKRELIRFLGEKLIYKVASKLNHDKVFISDSAWDIAVNILSDMCQGRGKNISSNVSFADSKNPQVMVLRPMRDFSKPEINYYLKFHAIDIVEPPLEKINSIQSLTENFISELDSVSTVFRTGEKLGDSIVGGDSYCLLCHGSLDTLISNGVSVNQSTDFSKKISTNTLEESYESERNLLDEFKKSLCYGCRLIFHRTKRVEDVPRFLLDSVKEKLMLESIEDFLI